MMKKLYAFLLLIPLMAFTPQVYGQVSDIDGNQYSTVVIGTQEWMAENLRTSRLNDGTPIPLITVNSSWFGADGMAMCWYNNDSALHHVPYGRLYNGYVAEMSNVCPMGWQVPSTGDWDAMISFLGGVNVAGGKLKEIGLAHWEHPNTGATNSSGFTALPGGFRSHLDGTFNYKGFRGGWFVTVTGGGLAFRFTSWELESVGSGPVTTSMGLSIRCFRYTTSTEEVRSGPAEINIYPVPANEQLHIDLGRIPEHNTVVRVTDLTGRILLITPLTSQINTLNISHLPAGIYTAEVTTNGDTPMRTKIIIGNSR